MPSDTKVMEDISLFICTKNTDIENFLKEKALRFERKFKSKTYFLVDEEKLVNKKIHIFAYFTVALQVFKIDTLNLSDDKIKQLDGSFYKRNGVPITEFSVFLIGQLGRNDNSDYKIAGSIILEYALSVISVAQKSVGGRIVLVECADNHNLIKFYTDNGFEVIKKDVDSLIQLIRLI